jgi:hypothetical protein
MFTDLLGQHFQRGGTHDSPTGPLLPRSVWRIARALRRERGLASARAGLVFRTAEIDDPVAAGWTGEGSGA